MCPDFRFFHRLNSRLRLGGVAVALSVSGHSLGATFTVTTTADAGAGSLRAAMASATATPATDVIAFNIPGPGIKTIDLLSELPLQEHPVTIDATTQPGYVDSPLVELNAATISAPFYAVMFFGGATTLQGVALYGYNADSTGIYIAGPALKTVRKCYIGFSASLRDGNVRTSAGRGIWLDGMNGAGTGGHTIGGAAPTDRNVISGNGNEGIFLENSSNNLIQNNRFGTFPTGDAALGNIAAIFMQGTSSSNTVRDNLISGSDLQELSSGVFIHGADNTIIEGNKIGTNLQGTAAIPNGTGIRIITQILPVGTNPATGTRIGNTTVGSGNVISGNLDAGILLSGPGTGGATITGNLIGTDAAGTAPLANVGGIVIEAAASNNIIGGTVPAARNVISGNEVVGIGITNLGSNGNQIYGNYIGLSVTGLAELGNGFSGISVNDGARDTLIGHATAGARNFISGNEFGNILVIGASTGTIIKNNVIGLATDLTTPFEDLFGVAVSTLSGTTLIGGNTAAEGNIIAGQTGLGIAIQRPDDAPVGAADTARVTMIGNLIGTNPAGSNSIGNTVGGILIAGGTGDIGDTGDGAPGARNTIKYNGEYGVKITAGAYSITTNVISSNGGPGIDLEPDSTPGLAQNANDPGDADEGGNRLLNSPVITRVSLVGGNTRVEGTINTTPGRRMYLELFHSAAPTALADGETPLGFVNWTNTGSGDLPWAFTVPGNHLGKSFTATLTDRTLPDVTSEFALPYFFSGGIFWIEDAAITRAESAGTATVTITRGFGSTGAASVRIFTTPGTATAEDYTPVNTVVAFAEGETSKTVTISITQDLIPEASHAFSVTLADATGGTLDTPESITVEVTITDDDPAYTLMLSSNTMFAALPAETTRAVFQISISPPLAAPISLPVFTVPGSGTAIAGVHYTAVARDLVLPAGRNVATFSVPILAASGVDERTFAVSFTPPPGALFATNTATARIIPFRMMDSSVVGTNWSFTTTWSQNRIYIPQSSDNLISWTDIPSVAVNTNTVLGTITLGPVSPALPTHRFMRIKTIPTSLPADD
jgi:parallel beta-helix repeat protein